MLRRTLATLAVLFVGCLPAHATPVVVNLSGLPLTTFSDPLNVLGALGISAASTLSVGLNYDPATAPQELTGGAPIVGVYFYLDLGGGPSPDPTVGTSASLTLTLGALSIASPTTTAGLFLQVVNFDEDVFRADATGLPIAGLPGSLADIQFFLRGGPTILSSADLPQSLDPSAFDFLEARVSVIDATTFAEQAGAAFTRTEAAPTVPEPSTMVLIGSGLVGSWAARRRRQRR